MEHLASSVSHVCQEHDNEPITNFCAFIECLKPLCPECIDIHNRLHHSQNTLPQITSLKNARLNCTKKIKAALSSLNQELENPLLQAIIDPSAAIREESKRVRELKEKINGVIDTYLMNLESSLKKNINKSHAQSNEALEVYQKMKETVHELESLHKDIHTHNSLTVVKKICALDLKSLMNKFKSDLTRSLQKRSTEGVAVVFDESYMDNFREVLMKMISLSKELEASKSNVQSVFTSPQKPSITFKKFTKSIYFKPQ